MATGIMLVPITGRAAEVEFTPTVIISEIGWAGSSFSAADEWLELTNLTAETIALDGWIITGAATSGGTLAIPDGSAIEPNSTFLICNYAEDNEKSTLGVPCGYVTTGLSLPNSGLSLVLTDGDGNGRDRAAGNGGGAGGGGLSSMVRTSPIVEGLNEAAWTAATLSVGFDTGATELGTPGTVEEWFAATVEADEVEPPLAPPWKGGETTGETVESVDEVTSEQKAVSSEEGAASQTDESEFTAPLGASGATETVKSNSAIETVEMVETVEDPPVIASEATQSSEEIASVATLPGNDSTEVATSYPVGTMLLNELVSDADEEWVEVVNPYNNVIDLSGWMIREGSGKATPLPDQLLGWEQYVVVLNPAGKLNNDGDVVELVDPGGVVVDHLEYGTDEVPVAKKLNGLARDDDGAWRVTTVVTPGEANQIVEPAVPTKTVATKKMNKPKESAEVVTTPKTTAAPVVEKDVPVVIVKTLRLSEIYPNTSGSDLVEEFVEIENFGNETVELLGWKLSDGSGRTFTVRDPASLQPGKSRAFTRPKTNIALNNTGDTVTLTAPDGTAVDSISYEKPPQGSAFVLLADEWRWSSDPTPDEPNHVPEDEDPRPEDTGRPQDENCPAVAAASGRSRSLNSSRTVRSGVALVAPGVLGKQTFYIESETGGIQIYKYDADFPDIMEGDRVSVSGTLSTARGEPRLKVGKTDLIEVTGTGDPPAAADIPIVELGADDHGKLVRVSGTVLSRSGNRVTLDDRGAELLVRIADGTDIDAALFARGEEVEVAGILVATESGIALLPRSSADIKVLAKITNEAAAPVPTGKELRAAQDRTIAMFIAIGTAIALAIYATKAIPKLKLWYAKHRAVRAAPAAAD
jgi:hypothetical protein